MTTDTEPKSESRVLEGIAWMVVTSICFAVVTGIVRYLGSDLPAVEAAFIRYLIGIFLMGTVLFKLIKFRPSAQLMRGFFWRGLVHGIGVILWFYAMARVLSALSRVYHEDQDAILRFMKGPHPLLEGRTPYEVARSSIAGAEVVLRLIDRLDAGIAA